MTCPFCIARLIIFAEDYEFAVYVFAVVFKAGAEVFSVATLVPIPIFILFRETFDVMSRV